MKKMLTAICVLGLAMLAFAVGRVSDGESKPVVKPLMLTGRTDQNLSLVTQLDAGRFRWFDTNLRARCNLSRHYDFYWHANTAAAPFAWDGRRLRVHKAGPTNEGADSYVADLQATYDAATGLRGTIQVIVTSRGEECDSGRIEFWAVADR